jgi:hypothetical protein
VLDEAGRGDLDAVQRRLAIIQGLPLLTATGETGPLVEALIRRHALPAEASDDALHVALAATNGMAYVLTWKCKHIANAEKLWVIHDTILQHGFQPPIICTPEELLGGNDEE